MSKNRDLSKSVSGSVGATGATSCDVASSEKEVWLVVQDSGLSDGP